MSKELKIVSGGQSGVDRAALDAAIKLGLSHGGWCPKGRRSETGPIPPRYLLTETSSANYALRTRWNIRDSDRTLIIAPRQALTGGTKLTKKLAIEMGRPLSIITTEDLEKAKEDLGSLLKSFAPLTLNVAGPRESGAPGIYQQAFTILEAALAAHVPQ